MLRIILCVFSLFSLGACEAPETEDAAESSFWVNRNYTKVLQDSLETGTTYLSLYSEIYSQTESKTYDLTTLVSIRNTDESDTIFLKRADYYNTAGSKVKSFMKGQSVYVKPLETVEIIISERDTTGGSGANFIFDWVKNPMTTEPLFEGVMISTLGTQGLSFTTQGKRIK